MKRLLIILCACITSTTIQAQTLSNYYHDGNYIFNDTTKILVEDLIDTYKSQLGLGTYDALVIKDRGFVRPDTNNPYNKGTIQSSYKQYHKGYEVEGTVFNVASKCGIALLANGRLRSDLDIDVEDTISEEEALDSAMAFINPYLWFSWEDTSREHAIKEFDSTRTSFPDGKRVIVKKFGNYDDTITNYALCWKFNMSWFDTATSIYSFDTFEKHMDVYVNASTGSVHTSYNNGTGLGHLETAYEGYKAHAIKTQCDFGCFAFTTYDSDRRIETWKINSNNYQQARPWDNNNNWVESFNITSASCHWGAKTAYDYFNYRHGNWNPKITTIYANSPLDLTNGIARSEESGGNEIIYVDDHNYRKATLDVLAHEFTHGVIRRTAGSIGYDQSFEESYGLNEGLADIFAMCTESWYRGWTDWTIGESFMPNFKRNFNDPSNDIPTNHGDTYQGYGYYYDGPYGKSGPVRKWFNHLSQGAWDWPVSNVGVGLYTAESVAYVTMMWNLWQTAGYHDMRHQTLAVADIHFGGFCSPVWKAVERAWSDVGVGGITQCKPVRLEGWLVAAETDLDARPKYPRFKVQSNLLKDETPGIEIINYNWMLPSGWTVDYSLDNSEIALSGVSDFNSKYISVIVTYEMDGDTLSDTLRNVFHFSPECNDASASPGGSSRMAQNERSEPGINNINHNNDINIYPNPVSRQLNITMPDNVAAEVGIYNISGQQVFSSNVKGGYNGIGIPELPTGFYFLKIKNEYLNIVRKVQIQQ